jgi:hypothetical protein
MHRHKSRVVSRRAARRAASLASEAIRSARRCPGRVSEPTRFSSARERGRQRLLGKHRSGRSEPLDPAMLASEAIKRASQPLHS